MLVFNLLLAALTLAVDLEQNENCPLNTDTTFCEMIATDTDDYYIGCDDPSADLLPHPEQCTLYIQCQNGMDQSKRSSVTRCCPVYDSTGDGCNDARLWFNNETKRCDYPENVSRSCSPPVAPCPDDLAGLPNTAYSPSAGCIWADSDESHGSDNFETALDRCR